MNYLPHMLGLPDDPETVQEAAQETQAAESVAAAVSQAKPESAYSDVIAEWDDEEDIELLLLAAA